MADITLEGEFRTTFGKGAARRLRVAQLIPATVYEGGKEPVYLQFPAREATNAMRRTNALYELKYGKMTKTAIVKDIQRNPVKQTIEHIDFYEVSAREEIEVQVPVFVEGDPKGAAVAFVSVQELTVKAAAANLPERITIDVEGLTDGVKILAKDIVLPKGVELVQDDPEEPVVSVEIPEDATLATASDEDRAAAEEAQEATEE